MSRAETLEWLADFCRAPQVRCASPYCRRYNEVSPPPWWRGNCSCTLPAVSESTVAGETQRSDPLNPPANEGRAS